MSLKGSKLDLPLFFKKFLKNPYRTIDKTDLSFHGFQFNILRNDVKLRKAIFEVAVLFPLLMWCLCGSDSTAEQIAWVLYNLPGYILGHHNLQYLFEVYTSYYGIGTHWSAAVIYGLMFCGLSYHLRHKLKAKNSLNICLSVGLVGLSIGVFEYCWMFSYYVFQGQTWILAFKWPQLRIILQNFVLIFMGLTIVVGFNYNEYKFNVSRKTIVFLLSSIFLWVFWIYYPFETTTFAVQTEYGLFVSSRFFPQTMYTIAPTIQSAYGIPYFVANEGVHLINTVTKIMLTYSFFLLFKIEKRRD